LSALARIRTEIAFAAQAPWLAATSSSAARHLCAFLDLLSKSFLFVGHVVCDSRRRTYFIATRNTLDVVVVVEDELVGVAPVRSP
jgi:hypothetical protein